MERQYTGGHHAQTFTTGFVQSKVESMHQGARSSCLYIVASLIVLFIYLFNQTQFIAKKQLRDRKWPGLVIRRDFSPLCLLISLFPLSIFIQLVFKKMCPELKKTLASAVDILWMRAIILGINLIYTLVCSRASDWCLV